MRPLSLFAAAFGLIILGTATLLSMNDLGKLAPEQPPNTDGVPIFPIAQERERWSRAIKREGAAQAYESLVATYQTSTFAVQHVAMHLMGELLWEHRGLEGLTICDERFAYACHHAFLWRAIGERGPSAIRELDRACVERFGPRTPACQHGIGHGILEYLGHDRLDAALVECRKTTPQHPFFGCPAGVFMEYFAPLVMGDGQKTHEPVPFNADDPYEPCPDVPSEFRGACYFKIAEWWHVYRHMNLTAIGQLCGGLTDVTDRETCFIGTGKTAADAYALNETAGWCKTMPEREGEILCRAGAMWTFRRAPETRAVADRLCTALEGEAASRCQALADLDALTR